MPVFFCFLPDPCSHRTFDLTGRSCKLPVNDIYFYTVYVVYLLLMLQKTKGKTMQDKRWNTFKNHPNICVFSCSFLAGFYCSFLMFLASSSDAEGMSGLMYLVMGAAFGIFLIYPAALTLQNAWQLCCRRYLDERLNTAKFTDMITVLWGAVCIRCYLMIFNIPMADWVTTLPFCETHGFAAGFP